MYLGDLWASVLRRWYLALVCLLISIALCLVAARFVKPTYEATASVVLVPPQSKLDPSLNRYMSLGGLSESADVLARSLSSEESSNAIKSLAPGAKYEVAPDLTTRAPILLVSATSASSGRADNMLHVVLRRIPVQMAALQDRLGISAVSRIDTEVVASDVKPKMVQKTRIRILVAFAVVLLLTSGVLVAAADGLLLRRARRREIDRGKQREWTPSASDVDLEELERTPTRPVDPDEVGSSPGAGRRGR